MNFLSQVIINTRADLEAFKGRPEYLEFMKMLKGSMTRRQNVAVYPDGYGQPDYDGPVVEPVWEDVEDLSTITRFGFKKSDFDKI